MSSDEVVTTGAGQAPAQSPPTGRSAVRFRVAAVALWLAVFAVWTATRPWPSLHALLFVLLGTSALLLTTAGVRGWRVATFRTMPDWEAAAQAAWTTGSLGTVVFFVGVLSGPSEGLAATARALALSFVPALTGGVLAAILLARMLRGATSDRPSLASERPGGSAWDLWVGRTLFVLLLAWPVFQARLSAEGRGLADAALVLHWPALLVLLGVAAALGLIGGRSLRQRAASATLAGAGALTSLSGLVQALLGIADADLAEVSAGISFLVTACVATLMALALVTYPGDDRRLGEMNGATIGARIAWLLFPFLALGLMAITFLMILTPMTRPG